MKIRIRLISALITTAVLLCMLAVFASASADAMLAAPVSDGALNIVNEDFTDTSVRTYVKGWNVMTEGTMPGGISAADTEGRFGRIHTDGDESNTYIKFFHQNSLADSYGSKQATAAFGIFDTSSARVDGELRKPTKDHSIAVYDFDLASDKYLDENGDIYEEGGDAARTDKLAYLASSFFRMTLFKGDTKANIVGGALPQFTYNATENRWYLGIGLAKAPLSNVAGEWNHITFIVDVNYTEADGVYDFSSSAFYLYVNGEFVLKDQQWCKALTALTFNTTEDFGVSIIKFETNKTHAISGTDVVTTVPDFSVCIDNMSANLYSADYEGQINGMLPHSSSADTDSYFELGSETDKLYFIDDVVFNGGYKFESPNLPIAEAVVGGETADTFFFSEGLNKSDKIVDGATIKVRENCSVYGFDPEACGINDRVYLELGSGAELTVAAGSPFSIVGNEIRRADESDALKVGFYTDSTRTEKLSELLLYSGQSIALPESVTNQVKYFDYKSDTDDGAVYALLQGYEMRYLTADAAEGVRVPLGDIDAALFAEMFESNKEDGIAVYPVYKELTLTYELRNDKNELIDRTGLTVFEGADLSEFSDPESLTEVGSAAPKNSTIRLNSDITIDGTNVYIMLRPNAPIFFDLNGHTLTRNQKTSGTACVFNSSNNSVLTVYSTKPGGEIIHTGFVGTTAKTGALINAWGNYGFNFTLGAYKNDVMNVDAAGDNLTIYTTAIVDCCAKNEAMSTVTVNGGRYYRVLNYSTALFNLATRATLTVKDAELYSFEKDAAIVNDTNDGVSMGVTATFDGCTLIKDQGYTGLGIVNAAWGEASSATFTNSLIVGHMPNDSVTGKLIFGENVTLSNKASLTAPCVPADGYYIEQTSGAAKTIKISYRATKIEDGVAKLDSELTTVNVYYTPKYITRSVTEVVKESAKVNLTTDNGFFFNLYLPESFGAKVYLDPECTNEAIGVATEFGMRYTAAAISPAHIEAVTFYVKALDGNGKLTEAVSVYGMTLAEYYTAVLEGDYTDLEKKLVVNAANYCEEVYKFVNNGASSGAYDGILTAANLTLTSYNKDTLTEDARRVSLVPLTASIYGATVYIGEGNLPVFAFVMQDGVTDSVSVDTYSIKYGARKTHAATSVGKYALCSGDYGIYDLVTDMTVTVDGNVGTYNIAAYISSLADDAEGRELAEAMYAYSLVSREYVTSE